jgi:hypothetical protein
VIKAEELSSCPASRLHISGREFFNGPQFSLEAVTPDGFCPSDYHDPRQQARWDLRNIPIVDGYVSAIAVEDRHLRFRYFDWTETNAVE